MKIRKLLLFSVLLTGILCGCGGADSRSKMPDKITDGEAYVDIGSILGYAFSKRVRNDELEPIDIDMTLKKFIEQKYMEQENMEQNDVIPEKVLVNFNTFILDEENFVKYSFFSSYEEILCGNYTLDVDGLMTPTITYGCMCDDNKTIVDLPNGELEDLKVFYTTDQDGRISEDKEKLQIMSETLEKYNISCNPSSFSVFLERFQFATNYHAFPKTLPYMGPDKNIVIPQYYAYYDEIEQKWRSWYGKATKLYKKKDGIVAKQKGISLEVMSEHSDAIFKLHFDNSEYSEDEEQGFGTLTFYADHTVDMVHNKRNSLDYNSARTWELIGEHFLYIEGKIKTSYSERGSYYCFYLDFDTNEVFLPVMIRCDAAWELYQEVAS